MVNRHSFIAACTVLVLGLSPSVSSHHAALDDQGGGRTSRLPGFPESLATITDLLDRGRGIEAENVSRALLAKVESLVGPDALEVATVLDLLGRAVRRSPRVSDDEKAALAERALAIKERALGPWEPDLATSLTSLGIQRTLAGNPQAARPFLERALAILEKAFGADDLSVAATSASLAGVLMTLRDDAGAIALLDRVLRIHESKYGATHIETIRTLFKVAVFHAEIGDYAGAQRYYERAGSAAEKTLGPANPLVFDIRLRQAIVLSEGLGDYQASAQLNERLVGGAERDFGPTDPHLTVALRNLALDRRDLGDYAAARTHAERSLAIAERSRGSGHPEVADSLHTLATVLAAQGAYGEAMQAFERATRINENVRRPADPELSRASWFIRDLVPVSGYGADDVPLFEQTVALREARSGLADPQAAENLTNLAAVLSRADDYARTRPLFERALAAQEAAYGPEHPEVAVAATNLADVLSHTGDVDRARALSERALGIVEQSLGPDHPRVAASLLRLAALLPREGGDERARTLHTRALAIQEKQLGPSHPDVAATLTGLSLLERRAGITAAAFATAARAADIGREHIQLTMRTLSERQALTYATSAGTSLDVMLSVVASDPQNADTTSRAWDALIRSRSIVLDEMVARQRATGATDDPDIVRLSGSLAAARQQLAAAVVRGIRNDPPERYRRLLDQVRRDRDRTERDLAEKSARFRDDQSRHRLGLAELQPRLPRDTALVAFVKYHERGASSRDGELSYLAFVLGSAASRPAVVPLGPATAIDAAVAQWQRQIRQETFAAGRSTARGEAAFRQVAGQLRSLAWDPLLPHLSTAGRVFIVPDGALHLVNFAALPAAGSQYLVETGPLLHYLSTERDIVDETERGPQTGGLMAVGDPAFGEAAPAAAKVVRGGSGCIDLQGTPFTRLPASLTEADDVVTLWRSAQRPAIRLVGAAATEAAVKSGAAGQRVLHLATHGFFLGDRCASVSEQNAALTPAARVTRENPLLLSGLVLAGANQRDASGTEHDDGILSAEEIAALHLTGVEWAVLSGCDTGVGEIRAGEGVFGLRRAFRIAGAKTVIQSLWPVEDEQTRQWMATLYRDRLQRNLSTAEAVRSATLSALRLRRSKGLTTHPLYWAGFVAAGDWR